MQEFPDDSRPTSGLDGLFRKSAEEFEPEFDPAAWADMQRRLDAPDRVIFWRILVGVCVLLLSLGSLLVFYRYEHPAIISEQTVAEAGPVSTPNPTRNAAPAAKKAVVDSAQPVNVKQQKPAAPGTRPDHLTIPPTPAINSVHGPYPVSSEPVRAQNETQRVTALKTPGKTQHGPVTKAQSETQRVTATKTPRENQRVTDSWAGRRQIVPTHQKPKLINTYAQKRSRAEKSGNVNGLSSTNAPITSITGTGKESLTSAPKTHRFATPNPDYTENQAVQELGPSGAVVRPAGDGTDSAATASVGARPPLVDLLPLHQPQQPTFSSLPDRLTQVAALTQMSDTGQQSPPVRGEPNLIGLSLQVLIAPDLSGVGLRNIDRLGKNIGFMVDYRLTKKGVLSRWSLQAGLLRSTKIYTASAKHYLFPSQWRQPAFMYTGVDARCAMLDIPLNLRYDVALRRQTTASTTGCWFVSGGVTTYIMREETYQYKYDNPNDPRIQYRGWKGETGRYDFSQLNLSAGYEQQISRRLSWQIEPFMKIPIERVGLFRVRLLSTGAFFSVRYRL